MDAVRERITLVADSVSNLRGEKVSYFVGSMPEPVPPALLRKCARAETATIGHRRLLGFASPGIRAMLPDKRIAGTAVTLAIPGSDSTLLHHVVQFLRPGDVLVIDRLGDRRFACLGGGVACAIKATGCVGVILDGVCTDLPELVDYDLPVWCRGPSPITTRLQDVGGAFNLPVSCGGAVVLPGYVTIADTSGALFMPVAEAEADVDWALSKQEIEPGMHRKILDGARLGDLSGATAMVTRSEGG